MEGSRPGWPELRADVLKPKFTKSRARAEASDLATLLEKGTGPACTWSKVDAKASMCAKPKANKAKPTRPRECEGEAGPRCKKSEAEGAGPVQLELRKDARDPEFAESGKSENVPVQEAPKAKTEESQRQKLFEDGGRPGCKESKANTALSHRARLRTGIKRPM